MTVPPAFVCMKDWQISILPTVFCEGVYSQWKSGRIIFSFHLFKLVLSIIVLSTHHTTAVIALAMSPHCARSY